MSGALDEVHEQGAQSECVQYLVGISLVATCTRLERHLSWTWQYGTYVHACLINPDNLPARVASCLPS